jgi:hypothetical protein
MSMWGQPPSAVHRAKLDPLPCTRVQKEPLGPVLRTVIDARNLNSP